MSEAQDKKIAELETELAWREQMLYHVLATVGEPVVVTKESLGRGAQGDTMISIEDDEQQDAFVFSLVNVSELTNEQ
jgi:hypothetical protein